MRHPSWEPGRGGLRHGNRRLSRSCLSRMRHCRRPEVRRRGLAKEGPIACQGAAVALPQPLPLLLASPRWGVVQRPSQHPGAELLPVVAGVEQMLMPGLVHRLGGGNRMASSYGEKEKSAVFAKHPLAFRRRPALLAGQLGRERDRATRCIEAVILQA